jgi:Transmembrane amino acid transporter protein
MSIAILLTLIFTGIGGRSPVNVLPEAPVIITAWAPAGTSFVDGLNAALNITFLWIGQICYPSFIAEMRDPREFPKALYCLTAVEFLLFTGVGIFVYAFAGQYSGAPAVVILSPTFKKIAFAFVFPTTIIIGVIYASVACKYVFARIFVGTRHFDHHTVLGWSSWVAIVFSAWILGWVIGEGIPGWYRYNKSIDFWEILTLTCHRTASFLHFPVFGLLLSLMSALFDRCADLELGYTRLLLDP